MNEKEYQGNEYRRFLVESKGFHDSPKSFINDLSKESSWYLEQLNWIENGSYGAGACIALKKAWGWINSSNRMNKQAAIGNVMLHALYGKPFPYWSRIPADKQKAITDAVNAWIKQNKSFAIENVLI